MTSHVEKIKEKLSIVDVVGSYVTLEKAGANLKAKCPFHQEKSASFFVSPARNSYYCFGCGAKGDIFSFVQQFEGLDFMGTLRILGERAGVEITHESTSQRTERERLYLIMEQATLLFQKQLSAASDAVEYLKKRGLTAKTIKEWRIGFSSVEWRTLSQYMNQKNINLQDCEKVGLIKKSEKNQSDYYDRFRGRIMFPIFDASGRVIAFSGRQFKSDGTEAKYINSPETPLFEKSKVLYGYDRAKLEIRKRDFTLLVEGQMDLLMAQQAGFVNTVASSGTALTVQQLEIVRRLSNNIVIAYDGDDAGGAAAYRGWQLALALGMEIKIAEIPRGKDPADLIAENQKLFAESISKAKHIVEVELARIITQYHDKREQGKAIATRVLPLIVNMQSTIEKSYFISRISHKSGIKEDIIRTELENIQAKNSISQEDSTQISSRYKHINTQESISQKSVTRKDSIQRELITAIFWQHKASATLHQSLDIREKFSIIAGKEYVAQLETELEKIKDQLIFEAEITYSNRQNLDRYFEELLLSFHEEYIREKFNHVMQLLQQAERKKDTIQAEILLKHCQELSETLGEITRQKLTFL